MRVLGDYFSRSSIFEYPLYVFFRLNNLVWEKKKTKKGIISKFPLIENASDGSTMSKSGIALNFNKNESKGTTECP